MTNLKINNFQEKLNIPKAEHDVLSFWDETHSFEKSVEARDPKKRYVFYDGPPFATGLPHYGHILASTIKDVVPRYWTMKGYRVDRVWGWDCHGIPIENMIEKELGLKGGKKGIEAMGIDKFNAACRSAILRFDKDWEKVIRRIGRWVDFKNSYKTMDKTFMESVWWAFSELNKKGLVYEGKRVILYCPRCATPLSNFEIAMDNSYKDLPGPSTTYKYKVVGQDSTYLLAWSTTPWNKLATPALAVNPDLTYLKVKQGDEYYILAKNTVNHILSATPMLRRESREVTSEIKESSRLHSNNTNKTAHYEIVQSFKGKELEKLKFEVHYQFYKPNPGEKTGVIIADNYVTDSEGTGVVTLAVYGEDDYRIMTQNNVQLIYHVDDEGKLKTEVTPWQGMFMLKVNPLVNEDLKKRNLIYHDEERLHSVPVCYRCETRLYQAPVPAWFINIQKLKPVLLAQNKNINWYPSHLKNGRFGKGLETAPDWNISRSRYWGTPMPVWRSKIASSGQRLASSEKETFRIIGSLEELKQWAVDPKKVEMLKDIHREYLDDLEVWVDDAKTVKGKRIPEVFDCWIESGSMPYASIYFPFKNKEMFESSHPAQFIAEYIAQTRAWFYTLHVMSVGLFGKHTFENAVTTGTVLAEDGTKMSKSKKNFPDPTLLFEKYGVDALRFYLMSSVVMKAENLNFSESAVREIYQQLISMLWNTFSFYKLYTKGQLAEQLPELSHILDQWIVSKTHSLIRDVTTAMDSYDTINVCRKISIFVQDLSTWYLRRSRERFKLNPNSMLVFGWVLVQIVKVMAPITPFISELIYQNLVSGNESVHLTDWPLAQTDKIISELERNMEIVRLIVEKAHAQRKAAQIKVRQPLNKLVIHYKNWQGKDNLFELVKDEVNVKQVEVVKDADVLEVQLDITVTPELKIEGQIRELMRKIQDARKEAGCRITEKIDIQLPYEYKQLSQQLLSDVKSKTLVESITWGDTLTISTGKS